MVGRLSSFLVKSSIVLMSLVSCLYVGAQPRDKGHFLVKVGEELPHFQYVSIEGDTLDTDFLKGQVVVVVFAASWCPFSGHQLQVLESKLWGRRKGNPDFTMIGICEDNDKESREEFLRQRKENGITIPFAFDEDEKIYRQFVTPHGSVTRTVLVDRNGIIADMHDVHTRRDEWQLRRMVSYLLKH